MAGFTEEVALGDVRGIDKGVSRLHVAVAGVVFHLHAHGRAIGVEYGETGTNLIREGEEI